MFTARRRAQSPSSGFAARPPNALARIKSMVKGSRSNRSSLDETTVPLLSAGLATSSSTGQAPVSGEDTGYTLVDPSAAQAVKETSPRLRRHSGILDALRMRRRSRERKGLAAPMSSQDSGPSGLRRDSGIRLSPRASLDLLQRSEPRTSQDDRIREVQVIHTTQAELQAATEPMNPNTESTELLNRKPDTDYILVQVRPSADGDGVHRPGEKIAAMITLCLVDKEGRSVISIKGRLKGIRRCHLIWPADETDSPWSSPEFGRGMGSRLITDIFWTDKTTILRKEEALKLHKRCRSALRPASLSFEFQLPETLQPNLQDPLTPEELARPRRANETLPRLPVELPPSMSVSGQMTSEPGPGSKAIKRVSAWLGYEPSRDVKQASIEYNIEVIVRRQLIGWGGLWGPTKKERLIVPLTVCPHAPGSVTVPRQPTNNFSAGGVTNGSLALPTLHQALTQAAAEARRERRFSMPAVWQAAHTERGMAASSSITRPVSMYGNSLQFVQSEQGRTQAWFNYSATGPSGFTYLELSFPALASVTTGREVPFLLHMSALEGFQVTDPLRSDTIASTIPNFLHLSLFRTVQTKSAHGILLLEQDELMVMPGGRNGIRLASLQPRECITSMTPHRPGAEVQAWDGVFVIEPYTIVAKPSEYRHGTTASMDVSQRTIPSFSFRDISVSYSLAASITFTLPREGSNRARQQVTQVRIPNVTIASGATNGNASNGNRRSRMDHDPPRSPISSSTPRGSTRGRSGIWPRPSFHPSRPPTAGSSRSRGAEQEEGQDCFGSDVVIETSGAERRLLPRYSSLFTRDRSPAMHRVASNPRLRRRSRSRGNLSSRPNRMRSQSTLAPIEGDEEAAAPTILAQTMSRESVWEEVDGTATAMRASSIRSTVQLHPYGAAEHADSSIGRAISNKSRATLEGRGASEEHGGSSRRPVPDVPKRGTSHQTLT